MPPRVNLLRGLHRLVLVGWALWALALIGAATWKYWNFYQYSSHHPTLKEFLISRARDECLEGLKSQRTEADSYALRWMWRGFVPREGCEGAQISRD